jgi:hypothetical protein
MSVRRMHLEECKVIDKSFMIVTSLLNVRCFVCVGYSARNRYESCDDNAIYDVLYLYERVFFVVVAYSSSLELLYSVT